MRRSPAGERHTSNGNRNGVFSTSAAEAGPRCSVCWNAARTEWYAAWTHRPKAWNSPDGNARYADRCSVEQATADDLPYGDRAFNAVTAFETVYFWGDLHRAFAEVARVLKPGGVFLVCCEMSNPGNDTWTSRIEGMQVFSPEELSAALADSGFTDIAVYRRGKENCCVTACTPDGRRTAEE